MIKKNLLLFTAAASTLFLVYGVSAHTGASGIVKERMEAMKSIGAEMKVMGEMLSGKTAYEAVRIKSSAQAIANHAGKIDALFPDTKHSRTSPVTEAAPAIWKDRSTFLTLSTEMASFANNLAGVSNDQAQALVAFKKLGGSCKSCHEDFRIKKN